jgi:hypothetical protein
MVNIESMKTAERKAAQYHKEEFHGSFLLNTELHCAGIGRMTIQGATFWGESQYLRRVNLKNTRALEDAPSG